ncbi:ABC transporter [Cellulomonas bogoriensis 69B4 = DSM 16987]|uniref:ABC transporter n=1 Tax=Cellulomonas bogoriensis 69B4 = DSM 16987 TaxID=1386082 RepID=A0A0A0C108_9CELL|nr:metal ABC transporter ATP-binding protein [Cellulomonas bogoriensis]KGM14308.1 ABC transporter [Cellulomonas bogoriensis 69B4 = DSM 16987]
MTPAVQAAGLGVSLGGSRILHDVDLTVHDGEVVALLGPNGSGKSTLVRALVGVVPHDRGQIHLLGAPLGPKVAWDRVGYVPQRISAATGVPSTARDVVVSGTLHRRRLVPPRGARRRADQALADVGLADLAGRPVSELSGGQQQRVLIARALVRQPRLLLLDEPVAGVDLPSQEAFARTLAALAGQGTTILVVLHELGALAGLVARAVALRHGRVVHDGPPPPARDEHARPGHDHVHPHEGDHPTTADGDFSATLRWRST